MMRGRARVLATAAVLVASNVPSILLRAQSDLDVLPAQGSCVRAGGRWRQYHGADWRRRPPGRGYTAGSAERACPRRDSRADPAADPAHRAHERRRSKRRRRGDPGEGGTLRARDRLRRPARDRHARVNHRAPERPQPDDGGKAAVRVVADRHLLDGRVVALLERRGRTVRSRARRPFRWRHDRVLPPLGCRQHGRRVRQRRLSPIRPCHRRQHRRRDRSTESRAWTLRSPATTRKEAP